MKKRQILNIVYLATCALLFILQIVAIVSIARLRMLPGILVFLIVLVFLVYDCLVFWFMFLRGIKKVPRKKARQVAKKRRIIAFVLAVVMACGCIVVSSVTGDVYKALKSVQLTENEEIDTTPKRAVYVRTYDTAETLEDAKDYRFGKLIHFDDENTQQAIDAIEAQLGSTIDTTGYSSVFEMANAFLSGQLDAVILASNYISVLEGDPQFAEFTAMTRILAEVEIEGGVELDSSGLLLNAEADIAENGKLKPFIVYVSGSDSRADSVQNNRSDVNILVAVNPQTRQVMLVNTPRDYFVPSNQEEGAMEKLSHAGVFGVESSIGSLENLYNHDINYYVQVSFSGVKGLVDAIGGVTVYSDEEFPLYEGAGYIGKGENHLNGYLALAYARTREGVDGGDLGRGNHQMEIIQAVVNKVTSGTTIITSYADILASLEGLFVTNVPMSLMSALVKEQLADMSGWNISMYSVHGTGGYGMVYSVPGSEVYVIEPDAAAVSKGSKLIEKTLAGEIMTADVINSTI